MGNKTNYNNNNNNSNRSIKLTNNPNVNFKEYCNSNITSKEKIYKNSFIFLYIIGKGGFGKVWKVIHKQSKNNYALKEMIKAKIIDKKSEHSIKNERDLLANINCSFIVNMHYAFQDYENVYIVMDYLSGGDLRYHLSVRKEFSECQISNILYIFNKTKY